MMLMLIFFLFTLPVTVTAEDNGQQRGSSFSGEYGSGGGTSFSLSGEHRRGRITGFRIYEQSSGIIHGIQFQYSHTWSELHGCKSGLSHEVLLKKNEMIVQVLGKYYSYYIQQLIFITNYHRLFTFGQPAGNSFNATPHFRGAFLSYISGHHNNYGLTGIGFHWDEPKLTKA
ncbi:zymogen granule membrane protein 16-like [Phascolarctos cinereus]|uniref:Zymogen granule membrane protein 16-like n=1 Tax=Phascolarctos cinereus TaxID=38626 RepID=A0A6P5KY55_PHACI|nr:zymogen granule membrane protein 16-like [Phascolarctos cinereus]